MATILKSLIGETLEFTWPILTNGEALSLSGRDLTLELVDPNGNTISLDYEVEHVNVLTFTYEGSAQVYAGIYQVTLYENKGEDDQAVVDQDAFELVETVDMYNWGNNTTLWSVTKKESNEDGGVNTFVLRFSNRKTIEIHTRNGSSGADADIEGANKAIAAANEAATNANDAAAAAVATNESIQSNETNRQETFENNETSRQSTFESSETSRDNAFAASEATRNAANQAALDCAETLAEIQTELDEALQYVDEDETYNDF